MAKMEMNLAFAHLKFILEKFKEKTFNVAEALIK